MSQMQIDNENGFTLIEVLVALTIFSIGLLALASMQVTSLRGNANAQVLTSATTLAEGTLEGLLSWDADDDRLDADVTDVEIDGSPFTIEGGGIMHAYYSIDTSPPGTSANFPDNVVRIDVRIEFAGGREMNLVGFKRRTVE